MLSNILDHLNRLDTRERYDQDGILFIRAYLAKNVASIPGLLKTIFLIQEDAVRVEILRQPILRRVFLCWESTGIWVCAMLQKGVFPSVRAVDYLEEISKATIEDYIGPTLLPRPEDVDAFECARDEVFCTLAAISQIVPSLTVRCNEETERVAATEAVWAIINRKISQPLVIGILSIDFVFNILLLVSFRFSGNVQWVDLSSTTPSFSNFPLEQLVIHAICVYFVLRKAGAFYSLLRLSTSAFRSYNLDFWNFIDLFSVIFVSATVFSGSDNPTFYAVGTFFLSLDETAGFLQVGQLQLRNDNSMFEVRNSFSIVPLGATRSWPYTSFPFGFQITRDVKWFLVVLGIVTLMFADIVHIVTLGTPSFCESAPEEFCTSGLSQSFLKLYSLIVGDVSLDDFSYRSGIKFLFVLSTFFLIIIFLNIVRGKLGDK